MHFTYKHNFILGKTLHKYTMSFPDKQQRKSCWDSRDKYWECLDKLNVQNSAQQPKECSEFRKLFENSCPSQWVTHFDRKRDYNIFKEKMLKEGYDPVKQMQ